MPRIACSDAFEIQPTPWTELGEKAGSVPAPCRLGGGNRLPPASEQIDRGDLVYQEMGRLAAKDGLKLFLLAPRNLSGYLSHTPLPGKISDYKL